MVYRVGVGLATWASEARCRPGPGDGVHTNLAESFFARLRRMVGGQHHKVGGRLLGAYAAHAAWLEDHRGQGNGALADRLIGRALATPVSRTWKGYWRQRAA